MTIKNLGHRPFMSMIWGQAVLMVLVALVLTLFPSGHQDILLGLWLVTAVSVLAALAGSIRSVREIRVENDNLVIVPGLGPARKESLADIDLVRIRTERKGKRCVSELAVRTGNGAVRLTATINGAQDLGLFMAQREVRTKSS